MQEICKTPENAQEPIMSTSKRWWLKSRLVFLLMSVFLYTYIVYNFSLQISIRVFKNVLSENMLDEHETEILNTGEIAMDDPRLLRIIR